MKNKNLLIGLVILLLIFISVILFHKKLTWKVYKNNDFSVEYPALWKLDDITYENIFSVILSPSDYNKPFSLMIYHVNREIFTGMINEARLIDINGVNGYYWIGKSTLRAGVITEVKTTIEYRNYYAIPDSNGGYIIDFPQVETTSNLYPELIIAERIAKTFKLNNRN